jgi:hypothetical protein
MALITTAATYHGMSSVWFVTSLNQRMRNVMSAPIETPRNRWIMDTPSVPATPGWAQYRARHVAAEAPRRTIDGPRRPA